jgi:SET domain-containing protein
VLLVKTEVKPSEISGLGVFATEDIPKGTKIWVFMPGLDILITDELYESVSEPTRSMIDNFAFVCPITNKWILDSDNDRYRNHSDTPNTIQSINGYDYAVKDIKVGEELTTDYRTLCKKWTELEFL